MANNGRWEVVRKKSKQNSNNNNNNQKMTKNQALEYLEKMPRAANMNEYGGVGKDSLYGVLAPKSSHRVKVPNDNNNKLTSSSASHIHKNESQVQKKPAKKPSLDSKVKPPKTIDDALRKVNVDELRSIVNMVQVRFASSPNLWLAELVVYFNANMNVDVPDPLFSSKDSNYPLSATTKEVRKIIDDTIGRCSKSVLLAFLEKTVVDMASEMARGVRVNGHRLILQAMILHDPSLVVDTSVKLSHLRNTYQNRQPICESILWVMCIGGTKKFEVGLRVWLQLLLPVIGMKPYSKPIVDYIVSLFGWHPKERTISDAIAVQQFFPVLDVVFYNSAKLPSNLHKELVSIYPKLKKVVFSRSPEKILRNFFPSFLSRLNPTCPDHLKSELLACLLYCLRTDTKCYVVWLQLYTRHLVQSSLLLEHLIVKWDAVGPTLPLLKETLSEFNAANAQLSANLKNGVVNGLPQCRQHCKKVLGSMKSSSNTPKARSTSSASHSESAQGDGFFSFRPLLFVLVVVLASALIYDRQIHGSFKESRTSRLLHDYGIVAAYDETLSMVKAYGGTSFTWATTNVPIYVGLAKQFCQPFSKLVGEWVTGAKEHFADVLAVVHDYLTTNIPIVLQWVDERFPGILDLFSSYIAYAYGTLFKLSSIVMTTILFYIQAAAVWLQENVFTGELAGDKLQKRAFFAAETIRLYAVEAFNWVGQHLQTNSK